MPRPKSLEPYTCVRCGLVSNHKNNMRLHLNKKKPCPGVLNDIELTGQVINYILDNRVYHLPKLADEQNVVHQTINNYNMMNNIISTIDPLTKLQEYIKYNNLMVLQFDDKLDKLFGAQKLKLESNVGNHMITKDDIFEIIENVTKLHNGDLSDMNFIFDHEMNKIKLMNDGQWTEYFISNGLKTIIEKIKEYFWDAYESYLIRKIHNKLISLHQRQKAKELLQEYYHFLAMFEVLPYAHNTPNNKIDYVSSDDAFWECNNESFEFADECMTYYNKLLDDVTLKTSKAMKNDLIAMLKRISKRNVSDLNKILMQYFNVDPEFKKELIATGVAPPGGARPYV